MVDLGALVPSFPYTKGPGVLVEGGRGLVLQSTVKAAETLLR